jgi:UPF0755 protein
LRSNYPKPAAPLRQRRDPYEERPGPRRQALTWLARLALLFIALSACLTSLFVVVGRWRLAREGGAIAIEGGSSSLNPVERLYLQTYLAANANELSQPAGVATSPVSFVIEPGENAIQVADKLVAANMLVDVTLFTNYLRYYGLDSGLEAGSYTLDPQWTIPQVANALTRAVAQDVLIRFVEGWRLEEMADLIRREQPAQVDADAFLALARRQTLFDLSQYDFLASLPVEATLEGYLFPDTYRLPLDADATALVQQMLTNFGNRVTPAMRQAYGAQGLTLRQAVTLASIVEREAAVPAERPLIAGVFLNRLAQGIRLEADPTVQYAVGYQPAAAEWWKSPLFQEDLALDSPYNTYLYPGLPPGPIANPGLAALEAVAAPIATDFVFFVVDCRATTPGAHLFSATYEEHLVNVERCR